MKKASIFLLAVAALLVAMPLPVRGSEPANPGKRWYVSQTTGSNQNAGTRENPFKNIQKAINAAASGDVILVAEGNYFGMLDCGNIKIDKGVSIFGGWSSDFSERDVLDHRTWIRPTSASNGTSSGQGTVQIDVMQPGMLVELDGLLMDRGHSVAYSPRGEGKPDGVETGMMQPIGTAGIGAPGVPDAKVYTAETAIVYIRTGSKCNVTIRNCAFLNGPNFGLTGSISAATVTVENCIFVNNRMAAFDLAGSSSAANSQTYFRNNTILFSWSRLRDLSDMGYGFRYRPRMDSYLDGNIIGCSIFSGLDRGHVDSPASKEAERVTTCENSLFFLNRQGELTLPGGGMFLRVKVDDFGDVEQLAKKSGNKAVDDPKDLFGDAIDEAYLKGFKDMEDHRNAMYANHYPAEKALQLFGAVKGYGAQKPE